MRRTALDYLYNTVPGRIVLKALVNPVISNICGVFLDSSLSTFLIKPFIDNNNINMDEFEDVKYKSFNEFFSRRIKIGKRNIENTPDMLIAPCDAFLTCIKIDEQTVYPVKQSEYDIKSLLRDRKLAKEFENGWCMVFRLCVDHYHRYIYPDHGNIRCKRKISGILHTVQPIALRNRPVFIENTREYMVIDTENFGRTVQMEVGAMLVGKIENYDANGIVKRGQEKGRFLYGGSTIILLLKENVVQINEEILNSSNNGDEFAVKMGQPIAHKI